MERREQTYFGRPGDFTTVRHLTLRGTNFEIGRALGELAVERYGKRPGDFEAPAHYARARREYVRRTSEVHWERLRGIAAALRVDAEDDRYDLTGLPHLMDLPAGFGCSAVYYPPNVTASGAGLLSRNYDFYIGALADMFGVPWRTPAPPVMSQPYVMQWHPEDGGHASLAIHSFDLLSGTMDGLNDAGLAVTILADNESFKTLGAHWEPHPKVQRAVGVHELGVMRLLLDTCASADEAKQTLLGVKQYYRLVPCRYLVADREGRSFVYENSAGRNVQHVIDGEGGPHVVTNFQLSLHPAGEPIGDAPVTLDNESYWRHGELCRAVARPDGGFTTDDVRAINARVATERGIEAIAGDPTRAVEAARQVPARTVWYSLYDQRQLTLEASFYLGEESHPDGTRRELHSEPLRFMLE